MKTIQNVAAASLLLLALGTVSAEAACDGDASTETVLGAGSGAVVGGLASHSVVGAAVGGVAGGVIGNAIGHSNNREDCRRQAYDQRDRYARYQDDRSSYRDRSYPDTDRTYSPDPNRDYPDRPREVYREYDDE
jgi:hypothetical protein